MANVMDMPDLSLRTPAKKKVTKKSSKIDRSTNLCKYDDILDQLDDIYRDVEKGFEDQYARSNDLIDYWDMYNCKLGPGQFYTGNSKIYLPMVHNAIEARKTRFVNQIFPVSNRNVDLITTEESKPENYVALLEHYILRSKIRTQVLPALIKNGDIEGQYTLYVSWRKQKRYVAWKRKQALLAQSGSIPELDHPDDDEDDDGIPIPGEEIEGFEEDVITDGYPDVEVISDPDLLVLPNTSDSIDNALRDGGSVTVIRRWTKAKIKKMVREKIIDKEKGDALLERLSDNTKAGPNKVDVGKEMVDAAGVKSVGGTKHALIYETWSMLELPDGQNRLCVSYMGGPKIYLGCHLNPNWSDRCSIISCPVDKVKGSFKGISKVKYCYDMQLFANDAINEAADSLTYSLMPITFTDPNSNPRIGSMVLAVGAIWEANPQTTQFAKMPNVWQEALAAVGSAKAEVAETLSVNPAAITQVTSSKKRNQAEIANEQQVDILTTADAVTSIEQGILTPMLNMFAELDHQYRDDYTLVNAYGDLGVKASMVRIPPIRMETGFYFKWFGVEAARTAQQIQMQISSVNVIRSLPPQLYQGWKINMVPVLESLFENLYGARLAAQIFTDMSEELTLDAEFENELLGEGAQLPVHLLDNDAEHIKLHNQALQEVGDPTGALRSHVWHHDQQMKAKQQMQLQQQMQAMQGQGQPQPGGPGMRPGAQPGGGRRAQSPAGAIPPDQMQDPRMMPRRAS
jgi:hypothetical protein